MRPSVNLRLLHVCLGFSLTLHTTAMAHVYFVLMFFDIVVHVQLDYMFNVTCTSRLLPANFYDSM